ncbi:Protein flp [Lachnellula suecica]|uniref:Protein flp n=1 Tax=Lachnellula suecica TaxID=602035 RepID=A0A8T9CFI6_9HELO|nr:Protein flp [Lachnellula suecica]
MSKASSFMQDGKFTPEFNTLVTETIERWNVPGFSIAVIDGDITCAGGYGLASLSEEKVKPETLFHCASMTKAFTAASVSFLVDDNEKYSDIQWTTPVSKIIRDDFVLSDSMYTEHVTVEDILSHRTGFPDHDDACFGIFGENPDTPKSVTRKLRHLPLNKPLRTTYQYSNMMYVAASHAVETVTGRSLGSFLREKLWEPLGMSNTYFGMSDLEHHLKISDLAHGYHWVENEDKYIEVPWLEQPEGSGAGEMISNVHDFAKFLRAMIFKAGPISEEGHNELVKPRTIIHEDTKPFSCPPLYALGWEINTFHGELVIGHDGSIQGFGSKMLYIPRLEWGVVAFGNTETAYTAHKKICGELIDDLLNIPAENRFDWNEHLAKEMDEPECKTVEEIYPDLPEKKLPLTLSLDAYTGTYEHEGYGRFVVELKDDKLVIDAMDRTWRSILTFVHVSGEFFVVEMLDWATKEIDRFKAEFQIGADGQAAKMGIALIDDIDDELIWFQKG